MIQGSNQCMLERQKKPVYPAQGKQDLANKALRAVAEKTGYSADMIQEAVGQWQGR